MRSDEKEIMTAIITTLPRYYSSVAVSIKEFTDNCGVAERRLYFDINEDVPPPIKEQIKNLITKTGYSLDIRAYANTNLFDSPLYTSSDNWDFQHYQ